VTQTLTPPPRPRRKVLLAEDDEDTLALYQMVFENEGHNVNCATDVASALEYANQSAPDVIFADLHLPDVDGFSLAKSIRADSRFNQTVLIAHSGDAMLTSQAADTGFDYFALKPADLPLLLEACFAPRQANLILLSHLLLDVADRMLENSRAMIFGAKGLAWLDDRIRLSRISREKSARIVKDMLDDHDASRRRDSY
jgi:CheY-like chemotaxis protein